MKIVITIPTYNESETIAPIIDDIFLACKEIVRHDIVILVVDDSSPDGTAEIVRQKMAKNSNIKLLLRDKKEGLGAAYIHAFKYAMNMLDADVIIEMDADYQHDPKDVPRLIKEIDGGFDCVIGSRFTKGGSIPDSWAFYRKFLSRYGSKFSKIVLGIKSVDDFTSGFKATRVKGFLGKINFDEISSEGFAYKIELLFRMYKMGAKIQEVPIVFGLRDRGTSKMEMNNFLDSLMLVVKLRITSIKNLLLFLIVGTLGFIVDTFIFNVIVFLGSTGALVIRSINLPIGTIASLVSGFVAMFVTFMLNNFWTFSDRKVTTAATFATSILVYYMSSYIPILFRSWLVKASVDLYGDTFIINNAAFLLGIIIGLVWNFTVYSKIIWKKSKKVALEE